MRPLKNNTVCRLRAVFLCAFFLAGMVFAQGCLKCRLTLSIKPDGSGKLSANYSLSENSINQINAAKKLTELLKSFMNEPGDTPEDDDAMIMFLDPDAARIKTSLEKYKVNGLQIERLIVNTKDSWRTVDMVLAFNSLAEIAKCDFFPKNGFSIYKRKDGNYVFHRPSQSKQGIPDNLPSNPSTIDAAVPFLQDFRVTAKVEVPGKIIETNAPFKEPYSATWTFDFNRDPKAPAALQAQQFIVVFIGEKLSLPQVRLVSKTESE